MAKPIPPIEVTGAERRIDGFKHVSVFLAQAFEQQAVEQAKAATDTDPALPGTGNTDSKQ